MDGALEDQSRIHLRELLDEESSLESEKAALSSLAGLKNIDTVLSLIKVKLETALVTLDLLRAKRNSTLAESLKDIPERKSQEALSIFEELVETGVSEDQKGQIFETDGYKRVKDLFQQLIMSGGGVFFESRVENRRKAEKVSLALAGALEKFAAPDDRYRRVIKPEKLPPVFRRFFQMFFSALAPENPKSPPFGIEEGEEMLYQSEKMRMPLSQAIHYMETELIPELERKLRDNPGDYMLQKQKISLARRLDAYKHLKFFPRSTPVLLEQGFYTDWLSGYTAEGELMVAVQLPVQFKSGTNLQRLQEHVKAEVARRLAGKGISPELDSEYGELKRIRSGPRGNSRIPSYKLDSAWAFRTLKRRVPLLRKLENREFVSQWLQIVEKRGRKNAAKRLAKMILTEKSSLPQLP